MSDGVAFIVVAGLVERRVQVLAVAVGDARPPCHRPAPGSHARPSTEQEDRPPASAAPTPRPSWAGGTAGMTLTMCPSAGASTSPLAVRHKSASGSGKIQAEQEEDQAQPETARHPAAGPPRPTTAPPMIRKGRCRMRRGQHEPQTLSESHGRGLCCVHPRSASYGRGAGSSPWSASPSYLDRLDSGLGRLIRHVEHLAGIDRDRARGSGPGWRHRSPCSACRGHRPGGRSATG